jgi:hypothetical protein
MIRNVFSVLVQFLLKNCVNLRVARKNVSLSERDLSYLVGHERGESYRIQIFTGRIRLVFVPGQVLNEAKS